MKTTKDLAEVIRRTLASAPELAAEVARERAAIDAEQVVYDGLKASLDDIRDGRCRPIQEFINEILHTVDGKFQPYHYYSKESDTLTAYFSDDADYLKRLNEHVTLYLSLETDDIVGIRVKGIACPPSESVP